MNSFGDLKRPVQSVGLCSGGAANHIVEAAAEGLICT